MPLSADRNTPTRDGDLVAHPVKASSLIYAGALVALDAAGWAQPGATATGLAAAGRAEERADNSAGANGDLDVTVRRGVFRWANAAGDAVDRSHIGGTAYIVDDQTVSATDGGGAQSAAGQIIDVDSDGVWVDMG